MQHTIEKKVDPEGAAVAATIIIANFSESNRSTVNIYTDASSQANITLAWTCFVTETNEEISGRIHNHTPVTVVELHVVKVEAAIIWIQQKDFRGKNLHPLGLHVGAFIIVFADSFRTYTEIITEIFIVASTFR